MYTGRLLLVGLLVGQAVHTTPVFHTGLEPPSPDTRVVRGDPPPLPAARVSRIGQWHTGLFHVEAGVGQEVTYHEGPPLPRAVVVRTPQHWHTGAEPSAPGSVQVVTPRVVRGFSRVVEGTAHNRVGVLFRTGDTPPNPHVAQGPIYGEPPPRPAAVVVRVGPMYTGETPPNPPAHRLVVGAPPPRSVAAVFRGAQWHTGLAALPVEAAVLQQVRWYDNIGLPAARVWRTGQWHTGQAAVVVQATVYRRLVVGQPPPQPAARVWRGTVWHTGLEPGAILTQQCVGGASPPFPSAFVERTGQWHTGAQAAPAPRGAPTRVVRGAAPPLPAAQAERTEQWHTGQQAARGARTRVVRGDLVPLPAASVATPGLPPRVPLVGDPALVRLVNAALVQTATTGAGLQQVEADGAGLQQTAADDPALNT